jgi:hypothetical protein
MAMLRELSNFREGYAGHLLSTAIALAIFLPDVVCVAILPAPDAMPV